MKVKIKKPIKRKNNLTIVNCMVTINAKTNYSKSINRLENRIASNSLSICRMKTDLAQKQKQNLYRLFKCTNDNSTSIFVSRKYHQSKNSPGN